MNLKIKRYFGAFFGLILFSSGGKPINEDTIKKLTNISENHDITSLIDQCLAKNKKNIIRIINENNFSNEDCIQITRIFLLKTKKINYLSSLFWETPLPNKHQLEFFRFLFYLKYL